MELHMQTQPQTAAPSATQTEQPIINILSVTPQKGSVEVIVRFPSGAVHTTELPGFAETLAQRLPSILDTRCHSGSNGSFAAELPHTETGHALEHAMLALLEQNGLRCRAVTEWNWRREPWGTFHISFVGKKIGVQETLQALRTAVELVESAIAHSLSYIAALGRMEMSGSTFYQLQPGTMRGGSVDPQEPHEQLDSQSTQQDDGISS